MPKRKANERQVIALLAFARSGWRSAKECYAKSSGKTVVVDTALRLIWPSIKPGRHEAIERKVNDRAHAKRGNYLRSAD
jgi:hypothetical protein